jgi:RNA polymerase sigma factor (sigma-70 family)
VNPESGLGEGAPRVFATTRWSIVLSAANSEGEHQSARAALAELCRTYWRAIFSFICRRGYSTEDAQDLTQDFFVMVLQENWLQQADRQRGRFRSFLLKSLQNFLINAAEKTRAQKRGGGAVLISWDDWMAESPSELTMSPRALESVGPDQLFDLRWAATVVEQALRRLREECERKGRLQLFTVLSNYLAADRADVSYAGLAATLGMPENAVKKQLHNLRLRYRWLLRDEVTHTVENPADVEDEIRHLCAVLAAANQ